jgi:DASH complex subunit DAD1
LWSQFENVMAKDPDAGGEGQDEEAEGDMEMKQEDKA